MLWGNNSGSNSLRGSSASCVGLPLPEHKELPQNPIVSSDFLKSNAFLFVLQKRDMLIAQCFFKWLKNILYGGHPSKFYFSIVNVNSAIIGCRKHFLHNLKQQPSTVFSNTNCNQFQYLGDYRFQDRPRSNFWKKCKKVDMSVQTKSTLVETGNGIVSIFHPDNFSLYVESVP